MEMLGPRFGAFEIVSRSPDAPSTQMKGGKEAARLDEAMEASRSGAGDAVSSPPVISSGGFRSRTSRPNGSTPSS
jgi:hypothetical protein